MTYETIRYPFWKLNAREEYAQYYNNDRTHYSLEKETPMKRPITKKPSGNPKIVTLPRIDGLHHKYVWQNAASFFLPAILLDRE